MSGDEALVDAARAGKLDRVSELLAEGVPPDLPDSEGTTALYAAAVAGHGEAVRALLEAGADPNRASLGDSDGLPLCGAACWGHDQTVAALLEGGAEPDRTESFDWTPLKWAATGGHTAVVSLLLRHGADPNVATRTPPLHLAAERGAVDVVRLLLGHGADPAATDAEGRTALDLALRWTGVDIEAELRRRQRETFDEPGHEVVVTRTEQDDETELISVAAGRRGEFDGAECELQTGHGAIATILEQRMGIRTPVDELVRRAMEFRYLRPTAAESRRHPTERPGWAETVRVLRERDDAEALDQALALANDPDPLHRTLGVGVLADPAHRSRALPLLRRMAREEADPVLLRAVVLALSDHGDVVALPELLGHARHPDHRVRDAVGYALTRVLPPEDPMETAELIRLTEDDHEYVRDWATMSLGLLEADGPEIRDALARRLADPSLVVLAEAARGLAERGDPRAKAGIRRLLTDPNLDNYTLDVALESAARLGDRELHADVLRCRPLAESHKLHGVWREAFLATSG
ncbi:ankyrin repeat domain-containing protein [Actinocorallia sp. API 0066]|uniref:ankyrin repeat domain-containing protein n=1 Tax=Actinocorallia sp. API 0066 TaxID=2896846 RepID=UPI001E3F3AC0|nr:ankyrin repeat domain-containing protein [Actinocorallia sp. API 0066]MCD0451918.1 ankyrin repeat domain-containing protein [Actinocorallia sp. API 0066]